MELTRKAHQSRQVPFVHAQYMEDYIMDACENYGVRDKNGDSIATHTGSQARVRKQYMAYVAKFIFFIDRS